MNKCLTKIFIVALAVCCALSVQLSVSASPLIGDLGDLQDWIKDIFPSTTQSNDDTTTTTTDPIETTTAPVDNTTTDLVNNSGTGTHTTTTEPTTVDYNTTYYYPTNNYVTNATTTTTEPVEEETSLSFEASLSDLFEDDSAAVIVQTPTEPYTIGGLVVNDGNNDSSEFSWQKIALVAVAVLFVILLALVVALLVQRSRKAKEEADFIPSSDDPSGPVPVEVMTPERIAELLGSSASANAPTRYASMTSEESAAAIKTAALMGQLNSYSDPLIRKYTDEPVMISPSAAAILDLENATAADVLRATDSMLDEITGDEKYASDISGYKSGLSFEDTFEKKNGEARTCPDCGNSVPADDVFCHNCGTYIG